MIIQKTAASLVFSRGGCVLVVSVLNRGSLLHSGFLKSIGTSFGMERCHFAIDCFRVRLVGNLPTAVRSPSKLASVKCICSSLGVEVHHMPIDGFSVGIVGDDAIAITAF